MIFDTNRYFGLFFDIVGLEIVSIIWVAFAVFYLEDVQLVMIDPLSVVFVEILAVAVHEVFLIENRGTR